MALIDYTRLGLEGPNLATQVSLLEKAGCEQMRADQLGGEDGGRAALNSILARIGPDDRLVVSRLDCFSGALRDVTSLVGAIVERGRGAQST